MIFRRRTTDQVYATLQQVQRRITEQGGGAPAPAPRTPGTATYRAPSAVPMRTPPPGSLGTASRRDTPTPVDQTPLPTTAVPVTAPIVHGAPSSRGVLEVPTQLAVTIMLVWVVTLAAAFVAGRSSAPAAPEVAPAPVTSTARAQDPEVPVAGKRLGDSIFVLKSVPRYNDTLKAAWQKEVDKVNENCRANAAKGWKDYFALREPENGGLEFVFGYANGQFGIDRVKFRDFAAILQRTYPSAAWKAVE